jgi:hypothetical protein
MKPVVSLILVLLGGKRGAETVGQALFGINADRSFYTKMPLSALSGAFSERARPFCSW